MSLCNGSACFCCAPFLDTRRRRDRDVKDERCYVRHSQWIINDVNIVMWIERPIEKKFYITSKK